MITLQRTRLAGLQRKAAQQLRAGFGGPWWSKSSRILLLLPGFFIGSNLTVHLENTPWMLKQPKVKTNAAEQEFMSDWKDQQKLIEYLKNNPATLEEAFGD